MLVISVASRSRAAQQGFGSRLKPLFDPECPVTFRFDRRTASHGLQLLVFEFTSPADSCFPPSMNDFERYYAACYGRYSSTKRPAT